MSVTLTVPAADRFPLAATVHGAQKRRGQVALVVGGTGILRRFYDAFAASLAARGWIAVTLDYRGIGGSRPGRLRGFPGDMADWGRLDIAGALDWIRAELDPAKLALVAHSAGGQLAGLAPRIGEVDRAVFVGSQLGALRYWPPASRIALQVLWRVMPPVADAVGYFPARILRLGEDLPRGVARQWAQWCRTPDYLFGRLPAHELAGYRTLLAPLLAVSFSDDWYAPRPAVEALLPYYARAPVTHRALTPAELNVPRVGHFGFFRPNFQATLWRETADWLAA